MIFPEKLSTLLQKRHTSNALRVLKQPFLGIDFSSNDYLGLSKRDFHNEIFSLLSSYNDKKNGSTGARLLTGNSQLHDDLENYISQFYNAESALLFNSGYIANIGLLSSVCRRGDIIFFDELAHASIREGINLSNAKSYKYKHLDNEHLRKIVSKAPKEATKFLITESVFSMDGDNPNLKFLVPFCKKNNIHLIIDEAHSVGVFGKEITNDFKNDIFARIVTFGKALGCHGSAVLGSFQLKIFLVNFAKSFIYTTALPSHSLATIWVAHKYLKTHFEIREQLQKNILLFKREVVHLEMEKQFIHSNSAIQSCIISGNTQTKNTSEKLQKQDYDVRPILSPTVPKGLERLRFCIHSFNTKKEIKDVLNILREIL